MYKILIIEDDVDIREELAVALQNALYQVTAVEQFEHVEDQVLKVCPDLILLDVTLPGESGISLCRKIRKFSEVPIIFVTSRNTAMDELNCMMMGGDDYVTKPYNIPVLLARIAAVLKRTAKNLQEEPTVLSCRGCKLHISNSSVEHEGSAVELTKNEFRICYHLFKRQGEIVSRADLIEYLWEDQVFIDDNTLSVNITRIRNKLKEIGVPDLIETKRGQGYRI